MLSYSEIENTLKNVYKKYNNVRDEIQDRLKFCSMNANRE